MMALREADLTQVLGDTYETSSQELYCKEEPITLFVKRNAAKGVVIVEWECGGRTKWSFHKDCFGKTAAEIAEELAEHVRHAHSYNDLSIRIFQYTTPVEW